MSISRCPRNLENTRFDLLVIGGGLFGACAAWDAALRGLSVALIDRGDFGGATSANSFKIVHGGIRYIQHGDVQRIRQSSGERRALLRIAPHLVRPLPVVIPTHGHGLSGRLALEAGLQLYDALTLDRNRGISDSARRLPRTRMLGREDVHAMFPGLVRQDATGAGVFYDARFQNPPRLVYAVIESAAAAGAVVANYVEAGELVRHGGLVEGVRARDVLENRELEIRARTVLNAAGPYAEALLERWGLPLRTRNTYSRDACFVVSRRLLTGPHALAVLGQTRDPDARLSRGARHLFLAPWREYTLVGVWHRVQRPGSFDVSVSAAELSRYVAEVRHAAPALDLSLDDIAVVNSGLVPFGDNAEGAADLRYGHRSTLIDHGAVHGCQNLLTLIGLRMTTARYEAERAIDLVCRGYGTKPPICRTGHTPVVGGNFSGWNELVRVAERETRGAMSSAVLDSLLTHYGSTYNTVLSEPGDRPLDVIAGSNTLRAQVYHAVRREAAVSLPDVIFRRTDLGTGENPGRSALGECAVILAQELGWTAAEMEQQIATTIAGFARSESASIADRHFTVGTAPTAATAGSV